MVCGGPATHRRCVLLVPTAVLGWAVVWPVGLLLLVVALWRGNVATPAAPLCGRDAGHWRRRIVAFGLWLAMILSVSFRVGDALPPGWFRETVVIGRFVLFVAGLYLLPWFLLGGVRATAFRGGTVTLTNVAPEFAAAVFARFCRNCGYDLTGNASGRCPECGAAAPAAPLRPGTDSGEPSAGPGV
jgi:hypothetical protein